MLQHVERIIPLHEDTTLLYEMPADGHLSCSQLLYLNDTVNFGIQVSAMFPQTHPSVFLFYKLWEILYNLQIK